LEWGLVVVFLLAIRESHFSGKPLLKVTGITMKTAAFIRPLAGNSHMVGSVYVPIENVSHGTGKEATVTNLSAKVRLRGKMLKPTSDFRVPIRHENSQESLKIDMEPGEKATITLVIGHPFKSDTMIPATRENLEPLNIGPFDASGISFAFLNQFSDSLYLASVTFRGVGVNQMRWFCIWNWGHENEYPNSIYGPLSLWKRTKLRLHLLGLLKTWQPYKPYRPDPNAPKFEWKMPEVSKTEEKK
jgi:hypothetical protein